jgi:carbonic anhydrase
VSGIDVLLDRNRGLAMSHPHWLGPVPTMAVAMVLCMDARVDVHAAFAIEPGEVHIIRNAGGVVEDDVIRSLAISQQVLGTREVMLVHHTDCGLAKLHEEEFRDQLAELAGFRPTWAVQAFRDPHESMQESLRRVRSSPFVQYKDGLRGFVFNVETGIVDEVTVD